MRLENEFFKVVIPVLGEVLGRSILDSLLLAYLLVLEVLLVLNTHPRFSIVNPPAY